MTTIERNSDTIRTAITQVLGILGDLQTRLDAEQEAELSQKVNSVVVSPRVTRSGGGSTADMYWYTEKCRELDEMAHRYSSKCREYDHLMARYRQLVSRQHGQRAASLTSMAGKYNASAIPGAFDGFDEPAKACPQGSGGRGKRSSGGLLISPARGGPSGAGQRAGLIAASDSTTPTKRARKESRTANKPSLFSSPPPLQFRTSNAPAPRNSGARQRVFNPDAEAKALGAAGIKCSSQETRLDSSDSGMPSDNVIELCPATDDEDSGPDGAKIDANDDWREVLDRLDDVPREKAGTADNARANRRPDDAGPDGQRGAHLQRILEAIGDCEPCRTFYSMPGLALPKRDPSTLCMHRKGKGKGKAPSSAPEPEKTPASGRAPPVAQSERRPSTPEHFWDIDYFPAIRTAGPEVLRKRAH
ncbi:hypothetical protein LPJ63_002093 [Coemansia sp. RSA 2711]|nr:hypothetical protein LPJ63_002093 [Coemansia sp. RSA 2711]